MLHSLSRLIFVAPLLVLPVAIGCQKNGGDSAANGTNDSRPEIDPGDESLDGPEGQSAAGKEGQRPRLLPRQRRRRRPPAAVTPPATLEMPHVVMTEAHRDTCLVAVGESMPDAELEDLAGEPAALADHLGEGLSVVLFWSSSNPYAVEALAELAAQAAGSLAESGVTVVAVHVGEPDDEAREQIESAGSAVDALVDPQQALFNQVATEGLPRVYLIDAGGSILWFDIEHSQSTLRQLETGILVALDGKTSGEETGT